MFSPEQTGTDFWNAQEAEIKRWEGRSANQSLVGVLGKVDWAGIAVDFWFQRFTYYNRGAAVPLESVVYHDSVISLVPMSSKGPFRFLRALLQIAAPFYVAGAVTLDSRRGAFATQKREQIRRTYAVLGPLNRLSFAAFLSEHCFLTPDFKVEEARYTNGAYILINQSETDSYENERVTLPPQGFYVEHPQMVAHDASRVGEEQFPTRAYRIARSRDGKPLMESEDVLRQEFPV